MVYVCVYVWVWKDTRVQRPDRIENFPEIYACISYDVVWIVCIYVWIYAMVWTETAAQ